MKERYNNRMRTRAVIIFAVVIIVAALFLDASGSLERYLALVFPPSAINSTFLKGKYNHGQPIRVLLVPGHEVAAPGTSFNGFWERNLNVEVAEKLKALLDADSHFDAFITQNALGYTSEFARYFETDRVGIREFRDSVRSAMRQFVSSGAVAKKTDGVRHNTAHPEIGTRLYGINKWARDHAIDIVLHIHFNDHPGHASSRPGKYTGFAIYIPEHQLPNFEASHDIARSLYRELSRYFPVSSHVQESAGIVEDQDLIAIGASASLDAVGVLIEYGYIYEPQVIQPALRPFTVAELAQQTYNGFKQYFEKSASSLPVFTLPHRWTREWEEGAANEPDIFALQIALSRGGWYPPTGKTRTNCPTSGTFGPCTRGALRAFQERYGLDVSGALDSSTIVKLNQLYGK